MGQVCKRGTKRNPLLIAVPHAALTPQTGGWGCRKVLLVNFNRMVMVGDGRNLSTKHSPTSATNKRAAFSETLKIRDRRLSKICWVVERPDHHCGGGLVVFDAALRVADRVHTTIINVVGVSTTATSNRLLRDLRMMCVRPTGGDKRCSLVAQCHRTAVTG